MKIYENCFVGVRIDPIVYDKIQQAYSFLKNRIPDISLVPIETSHITLYFVDDKNEEELDRVSQIVRDVLHYDNFIKHLKIKNSDSGYFDLKKHLVILYHIEMNLYIEEIYEILKSSLSVFKKTRTSFVPHLTLGRIYEPRSKDYFNENMNEIFSELDNVSFEFKTSELELIGRNKITREITTIEGFLLD